MGNIKISPKHGLNPTIPRCFFCGAEKDELVLMGKLKGDIEAPRDIVMDYIPCENCKKAFAQGILVIGVTETSPDGRPPIAEFKGKSPEGKHIVKRAYPTGSYVLATKDYIRRLCNGERADEIIKSGKLLLDDTALTAIQKQYEEIQKGEEICR